MALVSRDELSDDPLSLSGSEPLVPILQADADWVDPIALETWHQALSNTLSVEIPHDLMALWLYPTQGGVALLGPAELAADNLAVPIPSPGIRPEQLSALEKIVVAAGYGSVTCLPVSFGKRDVALILVAALQPGRYGPAERVLLQCVARKLAPMLGRVARQWIPITESSSTQKDRIAGLLEAVVQANRDARSPQRFLAGVSAGLAPLLPHDQIELLVPNASGDEYFRLGEHPGGPLWADPSLAISRNHLDVAAVFGSRSDLLVPDTYKDARWPRGFLTAGDAAGADIRAVIGVQLSFGSSAAYLLVGSIGPEIYGADDVELVSMLAGLIAPQIGEFVRAVPKQPPPEPVRAAPVRDESADTLFSIAGMLAVTPDPAASSRLIAEKGTGLLPYTELSVALKLSEAGRVVLLQPGEGRSLPELPLVPIAGTALARVLQGETPHASSESFGETRLIVPLRVAGKVHGALIFTAAEPMRLTELHIGPAQRLADIVAGHFELLRRAAMLPPPFVPGRTREKRLRNRSA